MAEPTPERILRQWTRRLWALPMAVRVWVHLSTIGRAARSKDYIEIPSDQLAADLVRLCRAQGVLPRDILQTLVVGESSGRLREQRRTVMRGLARRGWDAHELAEIFPLTSDAIRYLVRRR